MPGYIRSHPLQADDKALFVEWEGKRFALLYVTPRTHTLAWEGVVAFERLEEEVAQAMQAAGWENARFSDKDLRNRTSVALVLPGPDDSDELLKCRLDAPDDYARYADVLDKPLALLFARYDIADRPGGPPFFSFIAENAAHRPGLGNEVALKLSRSQKWTEPLLRWVIAHHRLGNRLAQEVAREPSVAVLNQHLGKS